MARLISTFIFFCFALYTPSILAQSYTEEIDFEWKEIEDFAFLDNFGNPEEFQSYMDNYVSDCLGAYGGAAVGAKCFVGYQLWDRELNRAYKELMNSLDAEGKKILRDSQRKWLEYRDSTIAFNSFVMDQIHKNLEGTMWITIRADSADGTIAPIVKRRTLYLRAWKDSLKRGRFISPIPKGLVFPYNYEN